MTSQLILLFLSLYGVIGYARNVYQPEQIRLTFHSELNQLVVSWVSFETLPYSSLIQYGPSKDHLIYHNEGSHISFQNDYCKTNSTRSVHKAILPVAEGKTVYYRISSDAASSWSDIYSTTGQSQSYPQSVALWGDMGINCQLSSVDQIAADMKNGLHQFAIHFGDTAYNMNDECGIVGDDFLNAAMVYSTSLPVIYTNGNHESGPLKLYHEYIYRLAYAQDDLATASGSPSNRYFMWSVGPVTYFTVDPDAWIYPPVYNLMKPQYEWLDAALATVNRTETPWLVGTVHRALYCTKSHDRECNGEALALRYGFLDEKYGLEALLQKYGVDLYFSGHTHHYERTWPVRDGVATQYDYVDPKATVHVQSGIGGVDGYDAFTVDQQPWEAFRDESYAPSYSRIIFHNDTHATIQQLYSKDGTVLDEFVLIQNNHGQF